MMKAAIEDEQTNLFKETEMKLNLLDLINLLL